MKKSQFISIFIVILLFTIGITNSAGANASIKETGKSWKLENDVILFELDYSDVGGVKLKQFYNKEAGVNYIGNNSLLFDYEGQYISINKNTAPTTFRYKATDADWTYKSHRIDNILMSTALNHIVLGKKLTLSIEKEGIEVRLEFEIFDGRSGLRYQSFIKNKNIQAKLMIERSDVISLDLPNNPHNIHYVTNSRWLSTNGNIEEASLKNNANDVPKCLITLYNNNEGWYIAPEVNWKTQYGPEISEKQETPGYYYQLRPFAITTAWATGTPNLVKVSTCPEAFQLVLFPGEEFEYIAVNMTVFKGDIVNGKMAVEEHFRKRFRFHDTTTSLMINDWDWFNQGLRTEDYFINIVYPKAKKAGYDIILIDDGWNNATADGKWITDYNYSRDPIVSNAPGIPDLKRLAEKTKEEGFKLGLWYSNSGGGHNKGRDLADPHVIINKKVMLQTMINEYDLKHQAVDLTQYWQNLDETTYSHPSDNVYRKNVLSRKMMNEVIDENPDYEIKVTSELDLYPNPDDRMTELIHLPNNGWMTITGTNKPIDGIGIHFGHLPLNAIYLGSGGDPVAKTDELYAVLSGRDVKAHNLPTNWSEAGIDLFGMLNKWRKGERVKTLTDQLIQPVFLGKGWDSSDASQWEREVAPYIWMYTNEDKSSAFVIATGGGRSILTPPTNYPLRWLDKSKIYLVQDVTLDDTKVFTYAFKGKYSGNELNTIGLNVNLYENTSPAKAYWIQEYKDVEKQVIFADQAVKTYIETQEGSKLIVNAIGEPNTIGTIVVYGKTENDAMTCQLSFDNEGKAKVEIITITNNNVPYPGDSGTPILLELEDFHTTLEKSNAAISVNKFDNGLGATSGYSSVMIMTAINDYVVYNLYIPFAGKYSVELNYKLSKTNRGEAQFYYINSDGTETTLGSVINESTSSNEELKTSYLGVINVNKAGALKIKMKLVGGGLSGYGKYIGANYIKFTKQ